MGNKPRMPKSYIAAVKPAAFARVLGKATQASGAEIKLTVLSLFVLELLKISWNLSTILAHQLIAGALTLEKSWPAVDNDLDVEAFIGIATLPTDDFTYKILLSHKAFSHIFRIKAELISTAGQQLTFGPVEVRIGKKTHN